MTLIGERPFNGLNESGWVDTFGTSMAFISDASAPQSPSGILRATYPAGFPGGTGTGNSYTYFGNSPKRTIYVAYWAKLSANFWGHSSGVNKQAYFYNPAFQGWFYFSATGVGNGPLVPQVRTQGTQSPFGDTNLSPNLVPSATIPRNQWYKIEIVAVGNTAGKADGSVDWYLNGVHIGSYAIQWETGNSVWGYFYYYNGWGGVGDTVPATMTVDWDHARVSGKN